MPMISAASATSGPLLRSDDAYEHGDLTGRTLLLCAYGAVVRRLSPQQLPLAEKLYFVAASPVSRAAEDSRGERL